MIIHILKDGTETQTIEGRVVTQSDLPSVYKLMESIERRLNENIKEREKES